MTLEDRQHFEELLLKAIQSGKKETSGLVDMIMHKLEKEIDPAIKKHVNGQFTSFKEEFRAYVSEDIQWKKDAMPVIEMGRNVQGFGKVSLYMVGFVASVAGAIAILFNLLKDK